MAILYEISKLDKTLIKKPRVFNNAQEWLELIYAQFGFSSYNEIEEFAKDKNDWFCYFYWSEELEKEFVAEILKFYKGGREQRRAMRYYWEVSLNWAPTNYKESWKGGN